MLQAARKRRSPWTMEFFPEKDATRYQQSTGRLETDQVRAAFIDFLHKGTTWRASSEWRDVEEKGCLGAVVLAFLVILGSVSGLTALAASTGGQDVVDGFRAGVHPGSQGTKMPYRLFVPDERARVHPLPLIVYLHGGGGAGTDNLLQIQGGNTAGTHAWTTAGMQRRHPAFVLAPQLPARNGWGAPDSDLPTPYAALMLDLVGNLSKEFRIDADRIYLLSQSLGGRGTWDLVSKRPDLWAAAVPLCGDGNPERVRAARQVAIWAFHGAKDEAVPVSGSRDLVAALRSAGGAVKYTEYPDVGHDVWTVAFAEPGLADWLFAQVRRGTAGSASASGTTSP